MGQKCCPICFRPLLWNIDRVTCQCVMFMRDERTKCRTIDDLDSDDCKKPFLKCDSKEVTTLEHSKTWKFIECFSLIIFTTIQIFHPILVRVAHKEAEKHNHTFLGSTTVFTTEIVKTFFCCIIIPIKNGSFTKFLVLIYRSFTVNRMDTLKVCLPALIFVIQNNLYFFALQRIDATVFSMTYQLRILTTALLMIIILKKRFTYVQWMALLISLSGAIIVQLGGHGDLKQYTKHLPTDDLSDRIVGLITVIIMCFTNAFGGVYLEAVLKKSNDDIFLQNIRLSLISLPMAGATMFSDYATIKKLGFFSGWNHYVYVIVFVSAFGGIIVSSVIRYADNIKKSFCQALALGGTAFTSIWMGDSNFNYYLLVGVNMVVLSVILYAVSPAEPKRERIPIFIDEREVVVEEEKPAKAY